MEVTLKLNYDTKLLNTKDLLLEIENTLKHLSSYEALKEIKESQNNNNTIQYALDCTNVIAHTNGLNTINYVTIATH